MMLKSCPWMFTGFMLRRKPLYAAIAQRKEERQAQLQLQYAHRIAGLVGPSAVIPGGYPTLYYPSPGIVTQVPAQPDLTYQHLGMRPGAGWRANGFPDPSRPAFQPSPVPVVSSSKICF